MIKSLLLLSLCLTAASFANEPSDSTTDSSRGHFITTLHTGQDIKSDSISSHDSLYTLFIENDTITITSRLVQSVDTITQSMINKRGSYLYRDPNRTRYLYSPSAFMLQRGEGSLSQKELFFTAVGLGINEYFNIQVASIIPLLFVDEGPNIILGAKTGVSINEYIHFAAGSQFLLAQEVTMTVPYLTFTVGNEEMHASFNVTKPSIDDWKFDKEASFSLSGLVRVSDGIAILTENFLLPIDDSDHDNIWSIATRLMSQNIGVDLGLLFVEGADFPLPWLDFAYHFDTGF